MDIQAYISSGIIELYVMGLCTPEEEKQMEDLCKQYPRLKEAVDAFELQLENTMMKDSKLPSPETDQHILKTLAQLHTAPVVKLQSVSTSTTPVIQKRNIWKLSTAAAVLLFLVSATYNVILHQKNRASENLISAEKKSPLPLSDYEVMINPAITPVGMYGQGSHIICRCTMFWDKKTGKAYIMIHHLPESDDSEDYQLWAEVQGKPVSVGIIDDSIRGRLIEVPNIPGNAVSFKVTLGKPGGESSPEEGDLYLAGNI